MKPTVPLSFKPSPLSFDTDHLEYEDAEGGRFVSWPVTGTKFFVPTYKYHIEPDEVEKANPGHFKMHGDTGFSIGNYHEFFVREPLPTDLAMKFGSIEVTFGEATPLAAFIFDYVYREKWFGEWEYWKSARILNATTNTYEVAFINACLRYKERTGTLPIPTAMDPSFLDEVDQKLSAAVKAYGPLISDLDPLRFYYNGLTQTDDTAACIYLFRTLEYYSFLTNQQQLTALRHDKAIGESEFVKRTLELVTKEEKGPFLKLINQLADAKSLALATESKLIASKNAQLLGEAIYSYRNSIVHGKKSYGYALQSSPVVGEDAAPHLWRELLRTLAYKAIENLGTKLI